MKSSFKKLRGLTHRHGDHHKNRIDLRHLAPLDELAQASMDMQDMRDCYDSLLSSAAATANSAYEFSESLGEMGACLLEKTALNDDEESGKVLLMLGKVQFELQKLVDRYRAHISQTITIPSESLLNELRTVEEMKRQCDEKRNVYEYMIMRQREKGHERSGKTESFSIQQLQAAHDEYDEEATLFVFRLKSLKQGQSRSLLTQAARHHAAQLCFFRKALKSLEELEPHLKLVTEQQHIDYQFSDLEDGGGSGGGGGGDDDDDDDYDDADDTQDDGELSFDYGQNDLDQDVSTSRNSVELDLVDVKFPQFSALEPAKENLDMGYRKSFSFREEFRKNSLSAPLFAENKFNPAERIQMQPSFTRKFSTYVLPTPSDTKSPSSARSVSLVPQTFKTNMSGGTHHLWHSTPLEPGNYEKLVRDPKFSGPIVKNAESVLRESNKDTASAPLPSPLADGFFNSPLDLSTTSDSKKIRRQAFSGPITSRTWPIKQVSGEPRGMLSGPILQGPTSQRLSSSPKVSPKVSPTASLTFMSSPKISELHELPRPPASSPAKSSRTMSPIGHSAPLTAKGHTRLDRRSMVLTSASPLPTPSQAVTRSFSIPSSSFRAMAMSLCNPQEATQNLELVEDMASPPLTPLILSNSHSSLTSSGNVSETFRIREGACSTY